MQTLAMVLTVVAISFCMIPGWWGVLAIAISVIATAMAVWGMTDTRTSPSNLGMDSAAFVYGIVGPAMGGAAQFKHRELAPLGGVVSLSTPVLFTIGVAAVVLFVVVQLLARRRGRPFGIMGALAFYVVAIVVFSQGMYALDLNGTTLMEYVTGIEK